MNKSKWIIVVITVLLIGSLFYFTSTDEVNTEKDEKQQVLTPTISEESPDFTLNNLEGEEVSLSDYRGQIVVLNFWATWCKYCDIEMPDLQKLTDENEDVVVLAVDVREDKGTVSNYIEEGNYTFPVVLDKKGTVASTYLVSAFPTSFFIDEEGILVGMIPGMMTYPQMNAGIEKVRGN